ncbi:MAG: tetratricopeptide repeat protein [Candidatus Omnitrophica bacterium]|nr:tetratricopeptide repeat protein [Candidatus Omnitrophota bacterium]MCA9415346.1 tetratricopeptide repeat protein [Candidatus Omnitrophota bacterium]MCA9426898.1 tetratricopeptide repeat protein [Candidatus Omnitrophota bacterium]MCA9432714.1 tetratricopeptide repeat protein [Candidatus Omnitrophota bacterium]MCA9436589.1 tetratricopeptide repeat protein [Candidatus Omnitrophota bacterium]
MKHKDVVETLHHSDWDIFKENFNRFWNENVKPYERTLLTLLTAIVVLGVGYLWYSDKKANDLESANQYLAEAKRRLDDGDMAGAISELEYIEDSRVSVPAEMLDANIAYASGEYEQAISILGRLVENSPESIRTDLLYQYSAAQESNGDFEGALQTLERIKAQLGSEPDTSDPGRESSVWDRYYFRKGRLLAKSGKQDEGIKTLLMVSQNSPWSLQARNEIDWIKATPVAPLTTKWAASGS